MGKPAEPTSMINGKRVLTFVWQASSFGCACLWVRAKMESILLLILLVRPPKRGALKEQHTHFGECLKRFDVFSVVNSAVSDDNVPCCKAAAQEASATEELQRLKDEAWIWVPGDIFEGS